MLLTLTSTAPHATDLGYLLHKHPERVQSFELSVGTAHVYYPEATDDRCTVALLLEVDPIGLVRNKRFGGDAFALSQYVNDRPYAASSMLAVALGRVFGTALLARMFEPLGWQVTAESEVLDPQLPRWGDSPYLDVTLTGTMPLSQALSHVYVLLPVLDGAKHYWVSSDEVDKLVRTGGAWLGEHPERDLITRRYLAHQRAFVVDATERLAALDDTAAAGTTDADAPAPARRPSLVQDRKAGVLAALKDAGAHRIVDLGCGEGQLLRELVADPYFTEILGTDVSVRALERAAKRLGFERMPDSQRARIALRQSSATYRDRAIEGFDAIVLMEVIEHLDPDRIPALERSVFADARPAAVVVTTPNADYNPLFESLPAGAMRHPDHRFEWTRQELAAWAGHVGDRFGYVTELRPVGPVDPERGAPTQLALLTRLDKTTGGAS